MFMNIITPPVIFRIEKDSEYEGEGKYGVFAEVLTFTDVPDYEGRSLRQIVVDLTDETGAKDGWDSGFSEGTFFFDDLRKARRAVKIIEKHQQKMCAHANKLEPSALSVTA